jgi:hypothetical protein
VSHPERSIAETTARLREALASSSFESEDRRKAALRRIVHQSAVGLTGDEVASLVAALRVRFPDRVYESNARAAELETRCRKAEAETKRLTEESERLQARVRALEHLVAHVTGAAGKAAHPSAKRQVRSARGGSSTAHEPASLDALFRALPLLIGFAADQDSIAGEVEGPMQQPVRGPGAGSNFPALLEKLLRNEGDADHNLKELDQRLTHLRTLPAALLAAVQQSWKAGTRSILEYLDPGTGEGGLKRLRAGATLDETRRRFQEFWNQFDHNIAHYYRGTFEKVYAEKMEEHR